MDEQRKQSILIAAAIFAARSLAEWDGKRSPKAVASASNAIDKAKFLVEELERRCQSRRCLQVDALTRENRATGFSRICGVCWSCVAPTATGRTETG